MEKHTHTQIFMTFSQMESQNEKPWQFKTTMAPQTMTIKNPWRSQDPFHGDFTTRTQENPMTTSAKKSHREKHTQTHSKS